MIQQQQNKMGCKHKIEISFKYTENKHAVYQWIES